MQLLDPSASAVATATAAVTWQLERPLPPTGIAITLSESALHVSWTISTTSGWWPTAGGKPERRLRVRRRDAQPVYDFSEVYEAAGGAERGGCSHGPARLLGFTLAVVALALLRNR